MKLGIVILNWNGKDVTPRCLDSIYRSNCVPDAVVVVDNASSDGSLELLQARFSQIVLIKNAANLGFAEGSNIGIRYLLDQQFELVLLLNNDAEVDPGCLSELKQAAEYYSAGAYAATIYEHGDQKKVWFAGGTISRLTLEARHDTRDESESNGPRPTGYITGCCLLFRSEALNQIGLLDSNFFAYYEDVDWCLRARSFGQILLYVPAARVYHEVSHSFRRTGSKCSRRASFSWASKQPLVLYLTYRNRCILAKKHSCNAMHLGFLLARHIARAALQATLLASIGDIARSRAILSGLIAGLSQPPRPPDIDRYMR